MPIPEDMLTEGEEVLVDTHPHVEYLARPVVASVVALALVALVQAEVKHAQFLHWTVEALLTAAVVWLAVRIVKWLSISLTVTNRRLDYKEGVFRRNTIQLRYQRISEVQCDQTVFGRLLGVGKLQFDVQGEGQPIVIPDVRKVRSMQRLINQQLDALANPAAPPAAPPPAAAPPGQAPAESVHDQLVQLDDLRQRGILSEQEFEAKKAELLGRL